MLPLPSIDYLCKISLDDVYTDGTAQDMGFLIPPLLPPDVILMRLPAQSPSFLKVLGIQNAPKVLV